MQIGDESIYQPVLSPPNEFKDSFSNKVTFAEMKSLAEPKNEDPVTTSTYLNDWQIVKRNKNNIQEN